jgi:serine/threonine protein kinase
MPPGGPSSPNSPRLTVTDNDHSDDHISALLRIGLDETQAGGPVPSWEPPSVPELQRALPQYEISGFIARGGMGAVYKGTQKALQRTVAIKVLPPGLDDGDRHFAERFKREAQTMARLTHPNIVTVYEAGENAEGWLYIVMEFIDGTDVGQLIASEGMVEPRRAIQITSAVCEALAFAHEEGIIHRDIKPSNIMLDRKDRVKVADFGLAKALNVDTPSFSSVTGTVGTPEFIAPEAHIDGTLVDQRADIYAVGVMLYQMLTGQIPRGKFSAPSSVAPEVDKRLDAIVDKALQTNREQRYSTATEMKTDVDAACTPLASAPFRSAGSSSKTRPRLYSSLITAVVVGTVAFFILSPPKPDASRVSESPSLPVSLSPVLTAVTKEAPFVNTLGMKFVPVPIVGGPTSGQRVLFSVWDTRVQDYATFATETKRDWPKPEFEQGPTHPTVMVSWDDATAFCAWLTERERNADRIGASEHYRLPSDHEWSCAVGIGAREEAVKLPSEKDGKIADVFSWGTQWPPPKGAGNYRVKESQPDDVFASTSPVGSFAPNRFGLYDLGGNVRQWCEDWFDRDQMERVLRGASWNGKERENLLSSKRNHNLPTRPGNSDGFRCVLAGSPAASSPAAPPP